MTNKSTSDNQPSDNDYNHHDDFRNGCSNFIWAVLYQIYDEETNKLILPNVQFFFPDREELKKKLDSQIKKNIVLQFLKFAEKYKINPKFNGNRHIKYIIDTVVVMDYNQFIPRDDIDKWKLQFENKKLKNLKLIEKKNNSKKSQQSYDPKDELQYDQSEITTLNRMGG